MLSYLVRVYKKVGSTFASLCYWLNSGEFPSHVFLFHDVFMHIGRVISTTVYYLSPWLSIHLTVPYSLVHWRWQSGGDVMSGINRITARLARDHLYLQRWTSRQLAFWTTLNVFKSLKYNVGHDDHAVPNTALLACPRMSSPLVVTL